MKMKNKSEISEKESRLLFKAIDSPPAPELPSKSVEAPLELQASVERKELAQDLEQEMVQGKFNQIGGEAQEELRKSFKVEKFEDLNPEDVSEAHPIFMRALTDVAQGQPDLEASVKRYGSAFVEMEEMLAGGASRDEANAYVEAVIENDLPRIEDEQRPIQVLSVFSVTLTEMSLLLKKYGHSSFAEELEDRLNDLIDKAEKFKQDMDK